VVDGELGAAISPCVAAVADTVVSHDPIDNDALGCEPLDRPVQKRHAVDRVLWSRELGVREPRVRVDRGVDM
jgi:hypothetical protein